MSEVNKEKLDNVISSVRNFLKRLKIDPKDFERKIRGKYAAHEKIIEALRNEWLKTEGFGLARASYTPPGGTYGIDFLGREFERGKIIIAVEIDSWSR